MGSNFQGLTMTTTLPIRVALVGGQTIFRHALRSLLHGGGFIPVGEANGAESAAALASRERPHVAVVDADQAEGLEGISAILDVAPDVRIIVLTSADSVAEHRRAVRLGARGLVMKRETPDVLMQAIGRVHAGDLWLESDLVSSLLTEVTRPGVPDRPTDRAAALTEREREVVGLIAEGLCNKDISQRLHISETTVRHHLSAIFAKLGVRDRLQLAIHALRTGLAKQAF